MLPVDRFDEIDSKAHKPVPIRDFSECGRAGSLGVHSNAYYDDGSCEFCGEDGEGYRKVNGLEEA